MIKEPLAILVHKSLREGVVPSQWLKASVSAIHKKGLKKLLRKLQSSQHNVHHLQTHGIYC